MSLQRAVKTPTRLVCSVIPVPPAPSFPPGEQMCPPTFHRTQSPSLVLDKSPGAPQPSSDILELNAPNNSCFPSAPPLLCITGNSTAGGVKHVWIYDFQFGWAQPALSSVTQLSLAQPSRTSQAKASWEGVFSPPSLCSSRAKKSHYKHAQASDTEINSCQQTTLTLIYPRGEGRDRGQVSGGFLGLILSILCGFAELSFMPSNTNSSSDNFA